MSPTLLATTHSAVQLAAEPSIGSSLIKMVLGLGGVIVAILIASKVLQVVRGGSTKNRSRAVSGLEVIHRQNIGKGLQLAVVRFGGRDVLVGIAGQNITFYDAPGAEAAPEEESFEATDLALREMFASAAASPPVPATRRFAPFPAAALVGSVGGGSTHGRQFASAKTLLERLRDATERR